MSSEKNISHDGIVLSTDASHVNVGIMSQSACASCHAKGFCSAGDMQEKIVEVKTTDASSYKAGELVVVYMEESLGFSALILGYLLPFVVLMAVLITAMSLTGNELLSGLLSLVVLLPYYIALYLNRDRLRKRFDFRIKRKEPTFSSL